MYQDALLFLTGSWAYPAIEMLWRGETHSSMALAGGICLCLINHICCGVLEDNNIFSRCLAGAGIITGVELVWGFPCRPWPCASCAGRIPWRNKPGKSSRKKNVDFCASL